MILSKLVQDMPVDYHLIGEGNTEITSLCMDSRQVIGGGTLCFCVSGRDVGAHEFAADDLKKKEAN